MNRISESREYSITLNKNLERFGEVYRMRGEIINVTINELLMLDSCEPIIRDDYSIYYKDVDEIRVIKKTSESRMVPMNEMHKIFF